MDEATATVAMDRNAVESDGPEMDRETFLSWVDARPERYERVNGRPVRMAPERLRHNQVKFRLCRALDDAIEKAGLPLMATTDGMLVSIDDDIDYKPDAMVVPISDNLLDVVFVSAPVIVGEVTSRSTRTIDSTAKLAGYFGLPSVRHYLILAADRKLIVHHWRNDSDITSRIVTSGNIMLDPPGLTISLEDIYKRVL